MVWFFLCYLNIRFSRVLISKAWLLMLRLALLVPHNVLGFCFSGLDSISIPWCKEWFVYQISTKIGDTRYFSYTIFSEPVWLIFWLPHKLLFANSLLRSYVPLPFWSITWVQSFKFFGCIGLFEGMIMLPPCVLKQLTMTSNLQFPQEGIVILPLPNC